ncbi:MAG: hypothetical protein IH614_09320 [Desulfuromonadales bacterium]|nr:hypothetical protein [Desulfuromonadales bacterium]
MAPTDALESIFLPIAAIGRRVFLCPDLIAAADKLEPQTSPNTMKALIFCLENQPIRRAEAFFVADNCWQINYFPWSDPAMHVLFRQSDPDLIFVPSVVVQNISDIFIDNAPYKISLMKACIILASFDAWLMKIFFMPSPLH